MVGLFARLGLTTLGALAGLAGVDVADCFGPPGVHAHRLACADDDRPARAKEPPAERIVERVWYRTSGLSAAVIVERIRWQMDAWVRGDPGTAGVLNQPRVAVERSRVAAAEPGRAAPRRRRPASPVGVQLRLWGGMSPVDERAVRAVARLAGMAGEQAVLVPAWQAGACLVIATAGCRPPPLISPTPTTRRSASVRASISSNRTGHWADHRGDRPAELPGRGIASSTAAPQNQARDQARNQAKERAWPGSLPAPSPSIVLVDARRAVAPTSTASPCRSEGVAS